MSRTDAAWVTLAVAAGAAALWVYVNRRPNRPTVPPPSLRPGVTFVGPPKPSDADTSTWPAAVGLF